MRTRKNPSDNPLGPGDHEFMVRAMREMGISRLQIFWDDSKKVHPDIWVILGDPPVIYVTAEWRRQDAAERRKRLVHEMRHILGDEHGAKPGGLMYSTYPDKDTYSADLYRKLQQNPISVKQDLINKFSTEEALGVWYENDGYGGESAKLPDGTSMGHCTSLARFIVDKLGRGKIRGFYHIDMVKGVPGYYYDPIELAEGHDFAVIDNRYIIDPWLSAYTGQEKQTVYDMKDPKDKIVIRRQYGDSKFWKNMDENPKSNPKLPPKGWWDLRMEDVKRQYKRLRSETKKNYDGRLHRIVGGIWWNYSLKARQRIAKDWEGTKNPILASLGGALISGLGIGTGFQIVNSIKDKYTTKRRKK